MELFVKMEEIDVILYNNAYYLYPAKGGERAFNLLAETLQKTKKCGVGSFVLRNREHLSIVRVVENVMILHTLRFLEEIRDPSEFNLKNLPKGKPMPAKQRWRVAWCAAWNRSLI